MYFHIDVSPQSLRQACHTIRSQVERGWYTSRDENLSVPNIPEALPFYRRRRRRRGKNLGTNFKCIEYRTRFPPRNRLFGVQRLLKAIESTPTLLSSRPTFVTTAKTLQLFMLAPFDREKNWPIYAVKHNGIMLLTDSWMDHCPPKNNQQRKYAGCLCKLLHVAGQGFHKWTTRRVGSSHRDWTYVSRIMSAQIEDNVLLYSGNVDCRDHSGKLRQLYMKIKTVDQFSILRAWTYGYLMETKTSVFGVVDGKIKSMFLCKSLYYDMDTLVEAYDVNVCVASLNVVLNRLRQSNFKENTVYELSLDSTEKLICVRQLQ